jgi:metallo-beta-lactamase family protein
VPIQPLYDEDDAIKALDHFVTMAYRRRFQVFPGVRATFIDAGHILGSAQIVFDIEEKGKSKRIVMSGDLGRKGLPILRDPDQPPLPVDYAIMESTYGSRAHGDIATMHDDLARVVAETAKRGGKVIIPAFAVGRTQEVLYSLHHLERTNRLPAIPVFIDSPLSVNITEVFKLHPDCYDAETAAFLEEHGSVFGWDRVRMITAREESMRLNDLKGPAIIIASSGMCEAGRILHHLRNNVEDDRNTILIVGFQAAHTLGRRLVERRPRVRIFGVERDLRAHVKVLNAFSAHGDMHDLMDFATSLGPDLKKVFLVHGEPDQQAGLLGRLAERKIAAAAPAVGEEVGL